MDGKKQDEASAYVPGDVGKTIGHVKHVSSKKKLPFSGLFDGVASPAGHLVVASTSAPLPPAEEVSSKAKGSGSGGDRHEVSGDNVADKSKPRNRKKRERVADPERDDRTLFIGNLPLDYTKKQLNRLCEEFGLISSVRFRSIAIAGPGKSRKVAVIKKEFDSERPVQNAYVVFCERESVQKAMVLQNRVIAGRHIKVDVASGGGHDYKSSVFVGNLPAKAEEEAVRAYFEENCATVDSVRLIRDSHGVGKGFGYVKFVDSSSVLLALKLHQSEFQGREMRVFKARKNFTSTPKQPADVKPKRSFSGEYAQRGDKSVQKSFQKGFQPSDRSKHRPKKASEKSREMKHFKKEKRMQNIAKRDGKATKGRKPKHSKA